MFQEFQPHLSDAAGMCTLHGLNWKHPETHNSSGNQDVRQLPLGQGLGGQRIELHPHYPMVWMKRLMSWNEKLKPLFNGQCRNDVVCFACREPGDLTWNGPHKQRGNRALGLPKGQAVPFILEAVAQASAIANNEVTNPAFVNNNTVSNNRLSNLCHRNCES